MRTGVYPKLRGAFATGDVVAFGGTSEAAHAIQRLTRSPVSHVGLVVRRQLEDDFGFDFVDVVEAATVGDSIGIRISRLSDRVRHDPGEVWWCPLLPSKRERLQAAPLCAFLFQQVGREYAFDLAPRDALFFGAELVVRALEAGAVLQGPSAADWTPRDLMEARLYGPLVQLAGKPQVIPGFSATDPAEVDSLTRARWSR